MESGRPTVAEIDLGALEFNYRQIRKRVPREAKILAIVKADAYGHGAVPISLRLEKLGVEALGVAISDEGVVLRKAGVSIPILVLGGVFEGEVDRFFRFRLTPVVFSAESMEVLSNAALRHRRKLNVHLKVDTGMGRLGCPFERWRIFLQQVKRFPGLEAEGILSHFSMTDDDPPDFTRNQWEKFQEALRLASEMGIFPKYIHIANSANLTAFPSYAGNLVRPGIMLYGAYPSRASQKLVALKPIMTLKTRIHFLKPVAKGSRISYGGTFVTKRESLIATLPIGYADGYSLGLSNCGEVLIRGRRAPVVGRVCMDYIMVDVTDIPRVSQGDEAVLLGRQGKERITVEEMAEKIRSNSYAVLCSVGKRVPRVYVEGSRSRSVAEQR